MGRAFPQRLLQAASPWGGGGRSQGKRPWARMTKHGQEPEEEAPSAALCPPPAIPPLQDINEIENLEGCQALEKLYLVENRIRRIRGLESLRNLKELHLYSNRIAKIENLEALEKLEVGGRGVRGCRHASAHCPPPTVHCPLPTAHCPPPCARCPMPLPCC
jgi:hypothetical protein